MTVCLILHYGKQNSQGAKSQVQVVLTKGLLFGSGDASSVAWRQTQGLVDKQCSLGMSGHLS